MPPLKIESEQLREAGPAVNPRIVILLATAYLASSGSFPALPSPSQKSPKVAHAFIDPQGQVHILQNPGREFRIKKEKDQVSSDSLDIAGDHETVGWFALFPNCCTSYPIALQLIIFRDGQVIQRLGDGMLLVSWRFVDGGRQVSFGSNTVHGDRAPHCELHDVCTGRLLDKFDGHATATSPQWVKELDTPETR